MRTSPLFRALLSFRLLTFFAMSLLPENRGGVDKISRYVSRSDVEEAIGGLAVDISPGQIYRKNKVRSGQSRQLCYLTGRGSQVPAAQRISTAMQPTRKQGFRCGGGSGQRKSPAPPRASLRYTLTPAHPEATRAESRASSA